MTKAWPGRVLQISAVLLVAFAIRVGGQQAGSLLIAGQIVDAASRQPLARAVVTLESAGSGRDAAGVSPSRVLTDEGGRFVFRDLAAGSYSISAIAPGYLKGTVGQRRPNGDGQRVELQNGRGTPTLTIPLWRTAAVTGTVTDEFGDAVVNTPVVAFERSGVFGSGALVQAATVRTDERGVYRISQLVPAVSYMIGAGRQLISTVPTDAAAVFADATRAASSFAQTQTILAEYHNSGVFNPGAPGLRVGDSILQSGTLAEFDLMPPAPGPDGRVRVFGRAFYRGSSAATAEPISLTSGEERSGVDLQLRLSPTVRVSGTITDAGHAVGGMGVSLVPAGRELMLFATGSASASVATVSDPAGSFVFPAVIAGDYHVAVLKSPELPNAGSSQVPAGSVRYFSSMLTVGSADVDGVTVTLQNGHRLTGRVVFNGTSQPLSGPGLQGITISLVPIGTALTRALAPGRVVPDLTLLTMPHPSGRYLVNITVPNDTWTLESVMAQNHDVSRQSLTLSDADVDVTVTFTDRPTTLTGVVRDRGGAPDSSASVLVIPVDYSAWLNDGASMRVTRMMRVNDSGRFSARGLPAGDYFVLAMRDEDVSHWSDVTALRGLSAAATRVTLSASEVRTVDLRTWEGR